jgi:hypothetical protein
MSHFFDITDFRTMAIPSSAGVKVGEHVTARYYETVTIRSRKPGETVGLVSVTEAIPVAKLGESFRGGFTRELKIGASIEAFGRSRTQLIFRTARGTSQALAIGDASELHGLRVGEQIVITLTQAMSVSLDGAH